MLIIKRSNCLYTAFGMVTLYKWSCSTQVERGLSHLVCCTATTSTFEQEHMLLLESSLQNLYDIYHC